MTSFPTSLALLRSLGLAVAVDRQKVLVSPKDRIDDDVRDYVRTYRQEILDLLGEEEPPTPFEDDG